MRTGLAWLILTVLLLVLRALISEIVLLAEERWDGLNYLHSLAPKK